MEIFHYRRAPNSISRAIACETPTRHFPKIKKVCIPIKKAKDPAQKQGLLEFTSIKNIMGLIFVNF